MSDNHGDMAALEAVLFAAGEAVPAKELADALELSLEQVTVLADRLSRKYQTEDHALMLLEVAGGYRLVVRPDYYPLLSRLFAARSQKLSRAGLETLAVVAYLQPVTKGGIEEIRGVQVDGVLAGLLEKGLIEERGRKEAPGRPILYGTTSRFLDHFGLKSLEDLPPLPEE